MTRDFDWSILTRPDVRSLVLGQLGFAWWDLSQHLQGLSDEEYLWAPAEGALSVVHRTTATGRVVGAGEWVAQWPDGEDHPGPRTIAWLVAHLTEGYSERWEWTFGGRSLRRDDVDLHGTATAGIAALTEQVERWQDEIARLDPDQLLTVGLSQATEIDAGAPFAHLVLHMNRELIHHGCEITVLRDLYRTREAGAGMA